ncbi:MAG: DUF4350 domain-containing protein [Candidatus Aquicultor sp.]
MKASIKVMVAAVALALVITGCSNSAGDNGGGQALQNKAVTRTSPSAFQNQQSRPASAYMNTSQPSKEETLPPGKVLLFDLGHKEIFNPDDVKPLGYSQARDAFIRHGYAMRKNKSALTEATLKDVDVVAIIGPMDVFTQQESEVLAKFVSGGGDILLTLHIADVCYPLAQRLGFQLSSSVIAQSHDIFDDSPKNLVATTVINDPLTAGVASVAVRKSWALNPTAQNARIVVATAKDAWADINPDDQYDQQEPAGSYGIVGAAELGKGRVVVIGDDAVFDNKTMDMAGNRILCKNIIAWFDASKR